MEDRLNQHGVMFNGILTRFCSMVFYAISLLSVVAQYYTPVLLMKIICFQPSFGTCQDVCFVIDANTFHTGLA